MQILIACAKIMSDRQPSNVPTLTSPAFQSIAADIALELIIAVQAVYPDDLELLWKEEIADILLSKQSN